MPVVSFKMLLWLLTLLPISAAFTTHHDAIINNLLSIGNTDLVIFTDAKRSLRNVRTTIESQSPLTIFNTDDLPDDVVDKQHCPAETDMEFSYHPFYTRPSARRHHTVVVSAKDLDGVMKVFDGTVLNCTFVFEPGIFHIENRFLFLIDPTENLSQSSSKVLQSSPHIQKHR